MIAVGEVAVGEVAVGEVGVVVVVGIDDPAIQKVEKFIRTERG